MSPMEAYNKGHDVSHDAGVGAVYQLGYDDGYQAALAQLAAVQAVMADPTPVSEPAPPPSNG